MKKLYFLSAVAALLLATEADARPQLPRVAYKKAHTVTAEAPTAKNNGKIRRAAAPTGKWVAKTMVESMPDEMGDWFEISRYTTSYNTQAQMVRDIQEDLAGDNDFMLKVVDYAYDEQGNNISQLVSEGPTLDELQPLTDWTRVYDDKLPGMTTSSLHYTYIDGEKTMDGNSNIREVTRNEAGAVTSVVYSTWYMDNFTPVQKVIITYGTDGKAETMTEYQLAFDDEMKEYWQEGFSFRNCKWVETDGQLWSLDYIYEGGNKIASFDEYSEGEFVGNMTVTYTADGGFETKLLCEAEGYLTGQIWTDLENGGFMNVIYVSELGMDEPMMYEVSREEYDIFGNNTFACFFDYYVGEDQPYDVMQWDSATSNYDANGCPTSVTIQSFWPAEPEEWLAPSKRKAPQWSFEQPPVEGEWENVAKFDFSDFEFITTTGVGSIEADSNAPVEFFSIDGRKVDNPANGLYIRRQGTKVTKSIVR